MSSVTLEQSGLRTPPSACRRSVADFISGGKSDLLQGFRYRKRLVGEDCQTQNPVEMLVVPSHQRNAVTDNGATDPEVVAADQLS